MDNLLSLTVPSTSKLKNKDSKNFSAFSVSEVFIDGKLRKAESLDDTEKGFGVFMHSLILTNSAKIINNGKEKLFLSRDGYEKAIASYTLSKGFNKNLIENLAPKISELTLDPDKNIKATAHLINESLRLVSRGSPDELIKRCTHILLDSKPTKLTRRLSREINEALTIMFEKGLKVYALAVKDIEKFSEMLDIENVSNGMSLVALVGIGNK
ncbi:MAG: hypothetical protein N3B21_15150 [Clostridia bacterium]|nr:hypothetical protein [Clostridia bacterium]